MKVNEIDKIRKKLEMEYYQFVSTYDVRIINSDI